MPSSVPHTGPYDSDFDDDRFDELSADVVPYDPDPEERSLALMAHLAAYFGLIVPFGSLLGPGLIYWLKRDESAFVEDQAREALNFQFTIGLAAIVSGFLSMIVIGIPMLIAVIGWWFVGTAYGAIRANEGEWYRHPRIWRPMQG
ncbi:DUF4870 domain-containing protein [Rubrivirga sp. IMCC43871]|uniref:DUF4870 domain-containing protein n=1 Tax=Rubrivirga sp. IMCC43871 TaxID=3391575 RepID=UPI00398FEB16